MHTLLKLLLACVLLAMLPGHAVAGQLGAGARGCSYDAPALRALRRSFSVN